MKNLCPHRDYPMSTHATKSSAAYRGRVVRPFRDGGFGSAPPPGAIAAALPTDAWPWASMAATSSLTLRLRVCTSERSCSMLARPRPMLSNCPDCCSLERASAGRASEAFCRAPNCGPVAAISSESRAVACMGATSAPPFLVPGRARIAEAAAATSGVSLESRRLDCLVPDWPE